jgi:hypothetical protein
MVDHWLVSTLAYPTDSPPLCRLHWCRCTWCSEFQCHSRAPHRRKPPGSWRHVLLLNVARTSSTLHHQSDLVKAEVSSRPPPQDARTSGTKPSNSNADASTKLPEASLVNRLPVWCNEHRRVARDMGRLGRVCIDEEMECTGGDKRWDGRRDALLYVIRRKRCHIMHHLLKVLLAGVVDGESHTVTPHRPAGRTWKVSQASFHFTALLIAFFGSLIDFYFFGLRSRCHTIHRSEVGRLAKHNVAPGELPWLVISDDVFKTGRKVRAKWRIN